MPSTPIPSRRAASAWPSSWSRIEAKKVNAETTATAYTVVLLASSVSRRESHTM